MLDLDWARLEELDANGNFAPCTKPPSASKFAKTQRFPCQACQGTGVYRGVRVHQEKSECFACGGKGYFMTSQADRDAGRHRHQVSKARRIAEARAAFDEQHPGLAAFVADAARWSRFAAQMVEALEKYGYLTDKQADAVRSMKAKCEASRAERKTEREKTTARREIDLGPVREMFERAVANDYKAPTFRAAGLVITRAPDHGRNPGALYVKTVGDGEYLGKILGTVYSGKPAPGLDEIATDPRGAATRYGQQSGTCSCCGRELSDPKSIALGIGPVCATRWGL